MKKLILTLTLVAAVASAYGQGSVAFSNGTLSKLSTQQAGTSATPAQIPLSGQPFKFGLWYGVGSAAAVNTSTAPWIMGMNSTTGTGLIASSADSKTALSNVSLGTDTSVNEPDIWAAVIAWSAQYTDWQSAKAAFDANTVGVGFYQWTALNVNGLGNPAISGAAIWEGATGTNPKLFNAAAIPVIVPEPTTIGLASLGAAALLIFRRRK